jgi:hypothetical protein
MSDNDLIRRGDAIRQADRWVRGFVEADTIGKAIAALPASDPLADPRVQALVEWMEGEPPKPWREEWFIAKTIHGEKVVLRALPEDWSYDYTTADHTYMIAANIVCWMQFPDSEYTYIQPTTEQSKRALPAVDVAGVRVKALVEALEWQASQPEAHPFMAERARAALAAFKGDEA